MLARHERIQHNLRSCTALFDIVFALLDLTPGNDCNALAIKMRNKVSPIRYLLQPRIENISCTDKHVLLNCLQEVGDSVSDVVDGDSFLNPCITTDSQSLLLGDVVRTNLKT
jgi:hypothetical protein